VSAALVPASPSPDPACDVVTRSVPMAGEVGGDVVLGLPDDRGGRWLVAADVVGFGLVAALLARSVRAAVRASAGWASGPAALLEAVERGIAEDVPAGSFVTAVAVHLTADGTVRAATAGHPVPVLLADGGALALEVEPGAPLAIETIPVADRPETEARLPSGVTLLLHTDGLVERRAPDGVRLLDPAQLAAGLPDDLPAAVDRLLAAADAVGAAEDDVSVLLARLR
jgi:serine phosphatase RsbU (regulator of sigma subunit)